jgi:hypothetical protein
MLPAFIKAGTFIVGTDLDPENENSKDWINTGQHITNNIYLNNIFDIDTFRSKFTADYVNMRQVVVSKIRLFNTIIVFIREMIY